MGRQPERPDALALVNANTDCHLHLAMQLFAPEGAGMDVFLFDQRGITGRNGVFSIVAERLERLQEAGDNDAPIVWRIGAASSLSRALTGIADQITDRRATLNVMRIIAHGEPGRIMLGAEGVSANTCGTFAPLAGKLRRLELHCCNVAALHPQALMEQRGLSSFYEEPNPNSGSFLQSRSADIEFAERLSAGYISAEDQLALRNHGGIMLVRRIAQAIRAPVVAAMRFQTVSIHQWDFEGPTIAATMFAGQVRLTVPNNSEVFPRLAGGSYTFSLTDPPVPIFIRSERVSGVPVAH